MITSEHLLASSAGGLGPLGAAQGVEGHYSTPGQARLGSTAENMLHLRRTHQIERIMGYANPFLLCFYQTQEGLTCELEMPVSRRPRTLWR